VSAGRRLLLALLLVDSAALALLEMFFLPLRFDGLLLPDLNGFPFPITAVLAAVTMPWLVSSAARLSPRMLVASSPLLVWFVFMIVFATSGPGGDVVLTLDWRSLLLLAAGALPGAVVLGRVQASLASTGTRRPGDGARTVAGKGR
jgi:hypothetical protein